MANALSFSVSPERGRPLAQLLHGYSEGHRLLESSFKPHEDITRLMLRMSDLSGHSMASGFEEYITGYPLTPLSAYAMAKTWYASEMPRPGCVWTHTIVIPAKAVATIRSLRTLTTLFKRPTRDSYHGQYSRNLALEDIPSDDVQKPIRAIELPRVLWSFYGNSDRPLVLPAKDSSEFESTIFALWSQQWPTLRLALTFCTGSLSTRSFAGRPFDIQCVPTNLTREVVLETTSAFAVEPTLLPSPQDDYPESLSAVFADAMSPEGGRVRRFLWEASDETITRSKFIQLADVFQTLSRSPDFTTIVDLVAGLFPHLAEGRALKQLLFGKQFSREWLPNYEEQDILFGLATTDKFQSFDAEALSISKRGADLCIRESDAAAALIGELFRASVNPLGEEILAGLISAMDSETARRVTSQQLQFLPALFRTKPALAGSPQLWIAGADRKRELFEAVASHNSPGSETVIRIVDALLESGSDAFIRRALDLWGKDAVYQTLDWTEAHAGAMSELCRAALGAHLSTVLDWVEGSPSRSCETLVAVAHVVAPHSREVSRRDSSVWLRTFRHMQNNAKQGEKSYIGAFLLTLAFCNAPPSPLELVEGAFERIHETAEMDQLSDSAWVIIEPFVPELSWMSNWDKCERLRRGLVSAFVRHNWPAAELRRRIEDPELLRQILKSARRVDGGEYYFRALHA